MGFPLPLDLFPAEPRRNPSRVLAELSASTREGFRRSLLRLFRRAQ
ncbi:hypothetical protein SSPIM334S_00216 [Streptomyces spiroverticillatus]